jgi:hypothetical protein
MLEPTAKKVLGVVAEMAVRKGHDLLAGYVDGSARYLNYSGKLIAWEYRDTAEVRKAIADWIAVAKLIAERTSPWTEPSLPALPKKHSRMVMLTPGGVHFGQGPSVELLRSEWGHYFFGTGQHVQQLLIDRALLDDRS